MGSLLEDHNGMAVVLDSDQCLEALLAWYVSLLPVLPALLFAYYVIRFQVVPLVLERTLVYGGIVVGLLLLPFGAETRGKSLPA